MSLGASKHLNDARVDPKRRVHGIGVYQTVLDQWGIPYDQPLPLLRRQVGAALEGVVHQRVTPIRSLAVDTHGHTHFGSGLAKLLGFDLYTRWHDMRGQWLHVPRDWPSVPGLEPVLMRDLDPEFIQSELGELLRMAASINDGYGSATFLLEHFGVSHGSIAPVPSGGNGGTRYTCATMPCNRHFAATSTGYWSAGNQSTNSSASFTRVLFASIAGVDGMRKS